LFSKVAHVGLFWMVKCSVSAALASLAVGLK